LGNDRDRDEDSVGKDFDQSIPPDGTFHGLTTGAVYSCALDATDEINCWGAGFRPYVMHQPERQRALPGPELPEGKFRAVSAGFDSGCALPHGPGIRCWGYLDRYSKRLEEKFIDVSVSARYFCGIRDDNRLLCWGNGSDPERREAADDYDQASPPPGRYKQVSAGLRHACAITTDNRLRCWGNDQKQQASPPEGKYRYVDCGWRNSCAVSVDGTVDCWGRWPDL